MAQNIHAAAVSAKDSEEELRPSVLSRDSDVAIKGSFVERILGIGQRVRKTLHADLDKAGGDASSPLPTAPAAPEQVRSPAGVPPTTTEWPQINLQAARAPASPSGARGGAAGVAKAGGGDALPLTPGSAGRSRPFAAGLAGRPAESSARQQELSRTLAEITADLQRACIISNGGSGAELTAA
eukprot:TRINITY_DN31271_c0_g1_i4.p1 TRINITY_DN31271_c0_g1~~TRINITY_DN31271_c0_g1_i4.p1  ORF type:complete len:183 (-),score=39.21 TRINITY_DN31271_c0_g1_i4:258-806(-)